MLGMEFERAVAGSETCFERRGLDFACAARVFLDPHRIVAEDTRRDCGEDRCRRTGMIDERTYVVACTLRGAAIRIISARKASKKEVADHGHKAHQD